MNTITRRTLNTVLAAAPKALAVAALGCALAGPVHADPAAPSVAVSFAGLDLSKPAGANELFLRLRSAARKVCGYPATADLASKAAMRGCISDTIHTAVVSFDHPGFSAWYAAHTGRAVQDARVASVR